ncbi:MAG: 30S ribosomal protein S16 [Spirochaetaceae bacterium]|jgi:small subunit ribosomal protein S16|nr:30S ribosomal protein S16 [Spirochaetaceae bacterium]
MSAVIRLKKFGTKKRPFYRIVVMDSRSSRDGRTIEELGYYHPIAQEGKQISFDTEKAVKWLKTGVLPSYTVRKIFNRNNIKMNNPELALNE